MRRLGLILGVFLLLAAPMTAAQNTIQLAIDLDWSGLEEQEKMAMLLQDEGLLPLPLVLVDGRLEAALPAHLTLPFDGTVELDIGVTQIAERPLYSVAVSVESGRPSFQVQSSELGMSIGYRTPDGTMIDALNLKGIVGLRIDPVFRDGVYNLSLPAGPYATLAAFAANDRNPSLTEKVSLVQIRGEEEFPPLDPTFQEYDYDIALFLNSDSQAIYRERVDITWADWNLFKPAPLGSIQLISMPSEASITINGYKQSSTTNTMVSTSKNLWSKILISKKGYKDCPLAIDRVAPPEVDGGPSIFTCILEPYLLP